MTRAHGPRTWLLAASALAAFATSACDIQWGHHSPRPAATPGAAVAVGSAPSGATDEVDRAPSACTSGWTQLGGTQQLGAPCSTAADCQPVCCTCDGEPWLSATCSNGVCVDEATTCARTAPTPGQCDGAPQGGVVVGGGPTPPTESCGGFSYPDQTCDECFQASCCDVGDACGSDADCIGFEQCRASCAGSTDASCESSCEDAYPAGVATAQELDSCIASACTGVCE